MDAPRAESSASSRSYGALLRDIYLAPSEAFADLAARPRPPAGAGLLGFLAVQAAFMATWVTRLDLLTFMRAQAEASGRPTPPLETFSPGGLVALEWAMGVSGLALALLVLLALAGLLLVAFNAALGVEVSYRQCLAVASWTACATHLVIFGLMLAVMVLRNEWNTPPDQLLQAGVSAFLERGATGKFVYSLAQSLDLFSAWMLALASLGMARVARRPVSAAAAVVVGLWLILVLGKAALAVLV